ncbi:hypothetical protein CTRI78_v002895 [Colletotrichum trifolii]|uniref:Uncharacterized protein n=1 Tax=Colletotrichum trifolii TaxID=5466 RepID=A0A4R8RKZ1_COLTR|nr:hypothetical protein CTRI78_v002895 [Colletotrichum trifolii]
MFATKPLGAFKNAIPSIHQPLPLSKKDSTKLLDLLKTTFRKNLDKEHGWASEYTESTGTPAVLNTKHHHSKQHASRDFHRRPTDQHLKQILSNPLFKMGVDFKGVAPAAPRDPMDVFDEAVAKGLMTRKAAMGCLLAKRQGITQSSAISVHDAMATSNAGLRVLQWLRSSGEERTLDFLADRRFVWALVPFLVAEGLEEVAWEWGDRLIRGQGPADENGRHVGRLVASLVSAKSHIEDQSLDTAFSAMIRADDTWRRNGHLPKILAPPFRILSWRSTVEAWKRPLPSTNLFESFVGTAYHIRRPLSIDLAHLDLHHPTQPNHEEALRILSRFDDPNRAKTLEASDPLLTRLVLMGMDTVSHLSRLGRTVEAESLLGMLESKFSDELFQKHRPLVSIV